MGVGNRNRVAGHNYERACVDKLKGIGYLDVATSRECSRQRDNDKVDICNRNEDPIDEGGSGRLEFNIQCKTLSKAAPYPKLLAELKEHNKDPKGKRINVVFHKQTEKNDSGRFMPKGEYAILSLDDFLKIVKARDSYTKGYKLLEDHFDCIPEEFKEPLNEQLKELGI